MQSIWKDWLLERNVEWEKECLDALYRIAKTHPVEAAPLLAPDHRKMLEDVDILCRDILGSLGKDVGKP